MKNLLIASTSTLYGGHFLEYLNEELKILYKEVKEIVFIPFARPSGISHDDYTTKVQMAFNTIDIKVRGIHTYTNMQKAITQAEGLFVGGGNTFVLVNMMHKHKLFTILKNRIEEGMPYLGTSAGSNICGLNMKTTNDMPIVYPPSFKTLGILPFNINPHYLDPEINSEHMGETREMRLKEFHCYNSQPVVGLREGSWLEVKESCIKLKGKPSARIFEKDKDPYELESESSLDHLR